MKKWGEIKQATLHKLFLDSDEADDQGYLTMFPYYANECLNMIANGVKPLIKLFDFNIVKQVVYIKSYSLSDNEITYINLNDESITETLVDYKVYVTPDKIRHMLKNGSFREITNVYGLGEEIIMGDDFLSFSGLQIYYNDKLIDKLIYLTNNSFMCDKIGNYKLYYNATYPEISLDGLSEDEDIMIEQSILNVLPTYIAAQCLSQDDIQRATILKNEFELMLSRLDTEMILEESHFESVGGWY